MLDYVALTIVCLVAVILFYGIIAIHDIPYDIAKHRNHPHQDAIHVAGWISLLTLHVIWPFLWIWATLYRADRGWGFNHTPATAAEVITLLEEQIASLNKRVTQLETPSTAPLESPETPAESPETPAESPDTSAEEK